MKLFGLEFKPKISKQPGLVAIQVYKEGIAVVHIKKQDQNFTVSRCDFLPCRIEPEYFITVLSGYVKHNHLENTDCIWILQPSDYSLMPIGHLPVTDEEISHSIRWVVKDRIDFSIDDAAITYFTVPKLNKTSKEDFIYAVITKKTFLMKTVEMIRETGLNLKIIDIPEFSLRNIMALMQPTSKDSIGILEIYPTKINLIIVRNSLIYLIRQIEWNQEKDSLDKFSAEIQRSLDYYENQLGQTPVQKFYLSPNSIELTHALPIETQTFSLEDLYGKEQPLPRETMVRCFSALGGALRCGEDNAPKN